MIPFLSRRSSRYPALTFVLWAIIVLAIYRVFFSEESSSSILPSGISTRPGPNGERYAPIYVNKLPKGPGKQLPKLQVSFPPEQAAAKAERERRQAAVKQRFEASWGSYRKNAFGADELAPIRGLPVASSFGGWGATLVDSLDALWILGMKDDFEAAVAKATTIDFNHTTVAEINVFETAIRYMGGLIGAYDVSGAQYPALLAKAVEIGDMIYRAFDTPNRMPITRWKMQDDGSGKPPQVASDWALLAEIGSFTLEFTRLSQLTGDSKYYDAVYRVAKAMERAQGKTRIPGLWPLAVNARELKWNFHVFTLGGMADSAFEYLPKMTAMIGGADDMYDKMYERAIQAARKHLFYRPLVPGDADILVSGSAQKTYGAVEQETQGQHLTCFVGGMVLMGARLYGREDEVRVGRQLTDGCVWAYDSMPTGIMPEVFHMAACADAKACKYSEDAWVQAVLDAQPDLTGEATAGMADEERAQHIISTQRLRAGYTRYDDKKYMLRPEAIESVFYAYRMTGDAKYQEDAWRMFEAIDRSTRTQLAHAGIVDVTAEHPAKDDKMESFWLAETLKYFYLIFSDPEHVSLDRYVLNTEAHTFLRPGAVWQETI